MLPDATRRTCTVNTYTCARTWLPAPLLCARDDAMAAACDVTWLAEKNTMEVQLFCYGAECMGRPHLALPVSVQCKFHVPSSIDPSYYEVYEWTDAMTSSTHARLQARLNQWQLKPARCTTMGFFWYQIVSPVNTAFIREHPSKKNIINLMICRRNLITNKITVLQSSKQGVQIG